MLYRTKNKDDFFAKMMPGTVILVNAQNDAAIERVEAGNMMRLNARYTWPRHVKTSASWCERKQICIINIAIKDLFRANQDWIVMTATSGRLYVFKHDLIQQIHDGWKYDIVI